MTLFASERDVFEGEEYTCIQCHKPFVAGSKAVRCCVYHPKGSCCHYTDRPVEPPPLDAESPPDHSRCSRRRFGSGCVPFKEQE